MTHWNKASKSSLHTKIWQLYHCTTWLLANIQCPVYPLKFYRLVSEGVNNNPPTPQIKYMYHILLQLTVRFLISYTTYILLSLKIYTEKMFLKTCFVSERLDTAFFFFQNISQNRYAGRQTLCPYLAGYVFKEAHSTPEPFRSQTHSLSGIAVPSGRHTAQTEYVFLQNNGKTCHELCTSTHAFNTYCIYIYM